MVNSQLFIIFAAVTYILPKMKKNFLVLTIALFALCVEAAPPLRVLMPMKINNSATVAPLEVSMASMAEGACCASQSLIGEGQYLQHSGTPRVLTILAAFQDLDFVVNDPVKAFDQYLNGEKQADLGNKNQLNIASVRQYFEICSHKQFSPQFDVVGPITLPQKMSYYGGSSSNGSDDKFSDFCKDAMEQAKSLVNDWSVYDNDKDGRVELVCVIFAGFGQNQGGADSTIWAKASYQNLKLNDALRISRFNCSPELFYPQYPDYINGTGVFIHEFSHCMGLPDLYVTNKNSYANNQGMEAYSVMDYGLYNYNSFAPCPYTAWEQEVMGWTEMEEIKLTDNSQQAFTNLSPVIDGGKAYKLVNADNDRDIIVMENVQQRGLNKKAGGHGLLVYHVDYPYINVNMNDSPNNNVGHPSVAVVPAGGLLICSYLRGSNQPYTMEEWQKSIEASTFPGTKEVTSLTDEMQLPNYCFWNGKTAKNTGFVLSSISEDTEAGTVSFVVSPNETVGVNDVRYKMTDVGGKVYYDLQGRKVVNPTKGLYIVNGKLVHRF